MVTVTLNSSVTIRASDDNRSFDGNRGTVTGFSADGYVAVTFSDSRWFYFEPREIRAA